LYLGTAESASEETVNFVSNVDVDAPVAAELATECTDGSVGIEQISVGHGRAFCTLGLLGLDLALGGLQVERVVAMAPGELVVDDFLASSEDLHIVLEDRAEADLVDAQHLGSRPDDAFVPRRHLPVRSDVLPKIAESIIRHFLSHRSKSALHNHTISRQITSLLLVCSTRKLVKTFSGNATSDIAHDHQQLAHSKFNWRNQNCDIAA
jgi:hypothetical protein